MAHIRFFNPEYSETTGLIRRAKQLVRNQLSTTENNPYLRTRDYLQLQTIGQSLEQMSLMQPIEVDVKILRQLLNNLSSIMRHLQKTQQIA